MGLFGGDDGSAGEAAAEMLKAQQEAKGLYEHQARVPESAVAGLAGLYGLPGFAQTIDPLAQARRSPLYTAMTGEIDLALQDEMGQAGRQGSVGGFLRSGVMADALAKARGRAGTQKARALSDVYAQQLRGIQDLSMRPDYTQQRAGLIQGMGQTRADQIMAEAQAEQSGLGGMLGMVGGMLPGISSMLPMGTGAGEGGGGGAGGLGDLAGLLGPALMAFSDVRLKEKIEYCPEMSDVMGHQWFTWKWNDEAKKLGITEEFGAGVMAHMVEKYAPEAIGEQDGYMTVDYNQLRMN